MNIGEPERIWEIEPEREPKQLPAPTEKERVPELVPVKR